MRICFLASDMSWRGGTIKMTALLSGLLSKSHSVYIVSLQEEGEPLYTLDDRVQRYILPTQRRKPKILYAIGSIRRFLAKEKIDVLINVDVGMAIYGIPAVWGLKTKVITWEHSNFYNNWGSRHFAKIRRFAAKHSNAVVVLTERDKGNYEANIPSKVPVYAIPNPATLQSYCYQLSSRTILSVGLLLPIKGYDRVIRVASKILPQRPDWNWVICGEGPEREKLEKATAEAGLEKQVLLPGLQKNMAAWYRSAAMLVMTSDMEGLPMTLLEGKGWGLPLVAFDIMTGPSDIIDNEKNGYLIQPFDVDAMAEKISSLMDHEELRAAMSANSRQGMEKFSEERILGEWKKLLGEVQ